MIDPKKLLRPMCFFPACSVRIKARAGSPWFFLRGRGCGKALNYKGICTAKSKLAIGVPPWGPQWGLKRGSSWAKKNPNERFGFNPPKEEVEETAEVAELLQRWGNYMSRPCATQEYLHCEMSFHNSKNYQINLKSKNVLWDQASKLWISRPHRASPRVKPLNRPGYSRIPHGCGAAAST
ncbi:hypothetical protein G3N58_14470 [Paraburkholderia sp. Ac-20342]|uniref:hypothetical protein n=1 Tax=Paraburkholderia sp. Ac-20342 TaxID=2703889 RepID=UPI00197E42B0|nr:hypothetical protein [Paraburkholderia sp. Ac-20342]MBN3848023.1 hypothetical protein [Paraburkholderia sp. Ac-20342]